jgi:hypothetical protein
MVKPFFRSFFKKWLSASKRNKMKLSRTKQAGSECTLSKPLYCPNYGESLILVSTGFPDKHTKMYRITSILFKRVGLHYNGFLMKMENISGGRREIPQSKNYQNIFECRTWANPI